jgi:enoyl-CoA hydratase/carnithine racemase
VVIFGSGEKAFVAGADIAEFADFSVEEGVQLAAQGQDILFNFVENLKSLLLQPLMDLHLEVRISYGLSL